MYYLVPCLGIIYVRNVLSLTVAVLPLVKLLSVMR